MIKVFLVRHADIELPPTTPDPSLSAAGHARAKALARVLGAEPIGAIFTSEAKRTKETVMPLAALHHVAAAEAPATLIQDLLAGPGNAVAVVAGHSNTIPAMIDALGVPAPLPKIGERHFDNLFLVVVPATGHAVLTQLKYGEESV